MDGLALGEHVGADLAVGLGGGEPLDGGGGGSGRVEDLDPNSRVGSGGGRQGDAELLPEDEGVVGGESDEGEGRGLRVHRGGSDDEVLSVECHAVGLLDDLHHVSCGT